VTQEKKNVTKHNVQVKKSFIYLLACIGACSIFTVSVAGQEISAIRAEQDSLFHHISIRMSAELSCYFTYDQGSSAIYSELGNNAAELKKLDAFISQALAHPNLFISRIRLTGYCSIEGSYLRNEALALERVEGFYTYLGEHYPQLYRYSHDQAWVAEDWDGLSRLLKEAQLQEREEIFEIIRSVREYDTRKALLARLNNGIPWAIMERELFPKLRRIEVLVEYQTKDYQATAATTPVAEPAILTASPQPSPKEREETPATSSSLSGSFPSSCFGDGRVRVADSRFALKTNLLLLAGVQSDFSYTAPVANVALEYYMNNHWSVELGAIYSNWRRLNSKEGFQGIFGYRVEPRYRMNLFNNDRLGVYLGPYGRVGDYDSRTMTDGDAESTVNYTGRYWDVGLSAGFTVRLGRRLGLEAGARGGYVDSSPNKYTIDRGKNWFDSRWKYSKVGMTDLNLSLIIFL
jgi:hypothetical protein